MLDQSSATDQDSYTVTKAFADENSLVTIGDLADVSTALTLGGAPELAERPYGPTGLLDTYGVTVAFSPTADTTLDALLAGTIQVANVYTADPRIQTKDLVVLEDPEGLFLASNVVPVVSGELPTVRPSHQRGQRGTDSRGPRGAQRAEHGRPGVDARHREGMADRERPDLALT